jgi:sulfite oxidase
MLEPRQGAELPEGEVTLRGWAVGAAGAAIAAVEVSVDDGATWAEAELSDERTRWSWTPWRFACTLASGAHTLVVRAHDVTGVPQPSHLHAVWNAKGYMNNSWHRVGITVR